MVVAGDRHQGAASRAVGMQGAGGGAHPAEGVKGVLGDGAQLTGFVPRPRHFARLTSTDLHDGNGCQLLQDTGRLNMMFTIFRIITNQ